MRRSSRRFQESQSGPSHMMDVDDSSDSDKQESFSQMSRSIRRINVSQNTQRNSNSQNRKTNHRQIIIDSDEEEQPSTSQKSRKRHKNNTSQSQRIHQTLSQASTTVTGDTLFDEEIPASQISPNTSLTEQEYHNHVANVVKYILAADHSNIPIDKTLISKHVDCYNKCFKEVFKSAQEVLKDVFGYELLELEEESKNDGKTQVKQTKSTKYILVNTVNCKDFHEEFDEDTGTRYVLLFLCLTHIFMSGDKCTLDSLKTFLKKLEIVTDQHTRHEQFGDAMEIIKTVFTKEKYINLKEDELTWGMRANKELKPRTVMEFVSMIYDGRELEHWPQEYERLIRKEQKENDRSNSQVNGIN